MNLPLSIKCADKLLILSKPVVMGIMNITPDSFYDGGRFNSYEAIVDRVRQMTDAGAAIIDVGAASTRPGAKLIDSEEELQRLKPLASILVREFPELIFSVDTYNSATAEIVVDMGFSIINDISGGEFDPQMFDTVARLKVPYVLMHIKGRPENMQHMPAYNNVVNEVADYFSRKLTLLYEKNISDIILDPGFGFGKSVEHNYALLKNLNIFKMFNCPVLAGLSRKSMVNKVLNIKADMAINGTTVLNTLALSAGADILRVHDVKEAVECINLMEVYNQS